MFDWVKQYCESKPFVTCEFPFDQEVIAWKVMGKLFCLGNVNNFVTINVKCNPQKAIELREQYPQVKPGYHMSKVHWNTIELEGLSEAFIATMIDDSFKEVVQKLPKTVQKEIYK